ncbi:MAG: tetratricopeptide (TPR) repeat protein [Myxococcota bacterium]|jgi:tetratricopeptide (TPR) repeat protein
MKALVVIGSLASVFLAFQTPSHAAAPTPAEATPAVDPAATTDAPAATEPVTPKPPADPLARKVNQAKDFRLHGQEMTRLGQLDDALGYYRKALELYPAYPLVHNEVGTLFVRKKNLRLAEMSFREALRLDPGFVAARANLAEVLRQTNQFDAALAELELVLKTTPKDAGAYFALAAIYNRQDTPALSLWAMEKFLGVGSPDTPQFGAIQGRATKMADAGVVAVAPTWMVADVAPAEPVKPDAPAALAEPEIRAGEPGALPQHEGDAAYYAKQYIAARTAYLAALKTTPDDIVLLYKLGATHAVINDMRGAQRWWRKALLVDPGRALIVRHLGLARLAASDAMGSEGTPAVASSSDPLDVAREALLARRPADALVVLGDQPDADAALLRGEALLQLDQLALARTSFEAVLRVRPESRDAQGALAEVLLRMGVEGPGRIAMAAWMGSQVGTRQIDPETFIVLRSEDLGTRLTTEFDDLDE